MNHSLVEKNAVSIDVIESDLTLEKKVSISILRLDKIHPVISGNKFFKLHYFLEDAINSSHKKIITFGGAYSSHLAAAAFAAKQYNLKSVGIVRGEKPKELSHTLKFCINHEMHLEFISRQKYAEKENKIFLRTLMERFGEHILIPEGGFSKAGVRGAAMITDYFNKENYSHVCTAVGTATTFAGLVASSNKKAQVIGFAVLKDMQDIETRLQYLLDKNKSDNYKFVSNYHFGGYAKKTAELISFMNIFFNQNHIPLDFVYTAKMMFGVEDLMQKNYFLPGSKILCLHTGGLQGNLSLANGVLNF